MSKKSNKFLFISLLLILMPLIMGVWLIFEVMPVIGSGQTIHATFTVNSTTDSIDANPGEGICATSGGECTLRAAIMETDALAGSDTIILPSGLFTLTIPGTGEDMSMLGDLDIRDSLTITGSGSADTIIDGNMLDTVFHINGSNIVVNFSGLTIQSGNGNSQSGGIFIEEGSVTVSDSTITNNLSNGDGGGIGASGRVTLTNTIISNNVGFAGGGILGGELVIINSTIISNTSRLGGGIYGGGWLLDSLIVSNTSSGSGGGITNERGVLTVINSIIKHNRADDFGGGIMGQVNLLNSTVISNVALDGGGIYIDSGEDTLIAHSLISENFARGDGGGMWLRSGTVSNTTLSGNSADENGGGIISSAPEDAISLNNVTLTNNVADNNADETGDGGGIFMMSGTAPFDMKSTILANNNDLSPATQHHDCSGTVISYGYNLIETVTGCAIGGDTTSNIIGQDPLLGELQDNGGSIWTHALQINSPAIDQGTCTTIDGSSIIDDQRGFGRPVDGDLDGLANCDIGAYERGASTIIDPLLDVTFIYTSTQGNVTIINIPSGAVTESVTLFYSPIPSVPLPSEFGFANHAFELDAYLNNTIILDFVFQIPVTITIHYLDSDVTGLDETQLALMVFEGNSWQDTATTCLPISSYNRDLVNNLLSVPICHLSTYALFGPQVQPETYLPFVVK